MIFEADQTFDDVEDMIEAQEADIEEERRKARGPYDPTDDVADQ